MIMGVSVVMMKPNKKIFNGYERFIIYKWLKFTLKLS
jgi:hypothetical protein